MERATGWVKEEQWVWVWVRQLVCMYGCIFFFLIVIGVSLFSFSFYFLSGYVAAFLFLFSLLLVYLDVWMCVYFLPHLLYLTVTGFCPLPLPSLLFFSEGGREEKGQPHPRRQYCGLVTPFISINHVLSFPLPPSPLLFCFFCFFFAKEFLTFIWRPRSLLFLVYCCL